MEEQRIYSSQGVRTQYGVFSPPGARVAAYVRSTGIQSGDDAYMANNLVPTLAQGLAKCRAGLGDYVIVLPGHAENVADATTISNAFLAGTRVLGIGSGGLQPVFTFTATTASIAISVADVQITGCRFLLDGINAVANAFNITAADFQFLYNELEVSTTAKAAAICMTLGTGAHRAVIANNVFRGLASSTCTDGILVSGAITDAKIINNEMIFPTTTTNGLIRITGVAVGLKIGNNIMNNTIAASVACINYANVAITGSCFNNYITVLNTGGSVSGTTGITVGGTGNLTGYFNNLVVNDPNVSGKLLPTADT